MTQSKKRTSFVPTADMVRAAENAFLAKAMVESVRPKVVAYQLQILKEHRFEVRQDFQEKGIENRVITNPEHSYLMTDEDFVVYHRKCQQAAKAAGLQVSRPDNCPLLEAQNLERMAYRALIEALEPVSPLKAKDFDSTFGEMRKKCIDLSLSLVAPYCCDAKTLMKRLMNQGGHPVEMQT